MGSGESSAGLAQCFMSFVDDRVTRLYGLPLEQFTPERNALAAQLRVEGDGATAAEVGTLRKPTAAAWAVNQLVRAEADLVEALLGAGGELRQAHRQAASGKRAEQLRAAADAERAAVDALVRRAPAVLGRSVGAGLAESIRNTLHAASSDDEARELVRTGTLTTDLRPIGLGPAAAVKSGGALVDVASPRQKALSREVEQATRGLERAEEALTRARGAADAAAERVKEARKRLAAAREATKRRR